MNDYIESAAARIGDGREFERLLPAQVLAAHRAQNQMDGLKHTGLHDRGYRQRVGDFLKAAHKWN
jgi:hypothetical protein